MAARVRAFTKCVSKRCDRKSECSMRKRESMCVTERVEEKVSEKTHVLFVR